MLSTENNQKNHFSQHWVLFDDAPQVWFWFILAQQARNDGAEIRKERTPTPRPCEPVDILKIVDRLYRNRLLKRDHLFVLRHYGRRQSPPNPNIAKEINASRLWDEAMDYMATAFIQKGIIHPLPPSQKNKEEENTTTLSTTRPNQFWATGARIYSQTDKKHPIAATPKKIPYIKSKRKKVIYDRANNTAGLTMAQILKMPHADIDSDSDAEAKQKNHTLKQSLFKNTDAKTACRLEPKKAKTVHSLEPQKSKATS